MASSRSASHFSLGSAAFTQDLAQRQQAIESLERREDDEPEPEQPEAGDQGRAHRSDLKVERLARLRDLEAPARVAARQDDMLPGTT